MPVREVEFEEGWLGRTLHDASVTVKANHDRGALIYLEFPFPLGWEEAEELLARMSRRFESYTGRSIEEHIKARPNDDH